MHLKKCQNMPLILYLKKYIIYLFVFLINVFNKITNKIVSVRTVRWLCACAQ